MSYAAIMVYVEPDGSLSGRVKLARQLAHHLDSDLIGVSAWMPRPSFVVEGVVVDPAPGEPELQAMQAALDKKGEQFRAAAVLKGKIVQWRSGLDFPTEFVARESRAADLIIVGRDESPHDPYRSTDAGALVLRAGPPGTCGAARRQSARSKARPCRMEGYPRGTACHSRRSAAIAQGQRGHGGRNRRIRTIDRGRRCPEPSAGCRGLSEASPNHRSRRSRAAQRGNGGQRRVAHSAGAILRPDRCGGLWPQPSGRMAVRRRDSRAPDLQPGLLSLVALTGGRCTSVTPRFLPRQPAFLRAPLRLPNRVQLSAMHV